MTAKPGTITIGSADLITTNGQKYLKGRIGLWAIELHRYESEYGLFGKPIDKKTSPIWLVAKELTVPYPVTRPCGMLLSYFQPSKESVCRWRGVVGKAEIEIRGPVGTRYELVCVNPEEWDALRLIDVFNGKIQEIA